MTPSSNRVAYRLTKDAFPIAFEYLGERWSFYLDHVSQSRTSRCMLSSRPPGGWLLIATRDEAATIHAARELGFDVPRRTPLHALMERAVAVGIAERVQPLSLTSSHELSERK